MIVDNEDGGLNIKFSHEDLVAMSPSDFQLLQLFVEALTEEYGKEEVNDSAQSQTDSRPVRRNDQIPPGRYHARRRSRGKGYPPAGYPVPTDHRRRDRSPGYVFAPAQAERRWGMGVPLGRERRRGRYRWHSHCPGSSLRSSRRDVLKTLIETPISRSTTKTSQYRARWISLTTLTSKYIEIPQEESIIA